MKAKARNAVFAEARSILAAAGGDAKVAAGRIEPKARALALACHRIKARQQAEAGTVELFTDRLHEEFQTRLGDKARDVPEPVPPRSGGAADAAADAPPRGAAATYAQLVAPLAPVGVTRTSPNKHATTLPGFKTALVGLQAGDWLACTGITFTGETVVKRTLTGYAKITFDSTCKFTGVTGANLPALWIANPSAYLHLVFEGCQVSNPGGGAGILQYASHHIIIDGFVVHDCGGSGVLALAVAGDIHDCFYRGEVSRIGLNHAYDPHAEKGSGLQGMILGDAGQGHFRGNRVAVYGHDCSYSGGSVVELGDPSSSYPSYGNQLWVKAHAMLFKSLTQTGGNAVNAWGHMHDNDFKIVEADDLMGFAFSADLAGTQPGNVVEIGTASGCVQNPRWKGQSPWQKQGGIVYKSVSTG